MWGGQGEELLIGGNKDDKEEVVSGLGRDFALSTRKPGAGQDAGIHQLLHLVLEYFRQLFSDLCLCLLLKSCWSVGYYQVLQLGDLVAIQLYRLKLEVGAFYLAL